MTDHDPLSGLRATRAPEPLRDRVLAAARSALAERLAPTLWERLLELQGLRVAWATACGALIVAHLLIGPLPAGDAHPPAGLARGRVPELPGELREVLQLPASLPLPSLPGESASTTTDAQGSRAFNDLTRKG